MRSHSHHASPKRSYLQPSGHSDSRLHPDHHYPGGVVVVGRRGSREEHEGQRYLDQRRRSADPAVMMNYEQQAVYRGTNTQPSPYMVPQATDKDKRGSRPMFEDAGVEEGSSQSCDVLAPANITFTLEEAVEDTKSASSTSTLVEHSSGSPPRLPQDMTATHKPLSQEMFAEDERSEMLMLSTVREGVPLSSQPMYYDPAFSQAAPPYYGLSQPSPPKSRHGKSLTDINSAGTAMSMAGGTSNLLALRQCLSQSVELPHYNPSGQQRYANDSLPRHTRMLAPPGTMKSVPHSQIHRMASDSHLNYEGPPGQKMSMVSALNRVREEIEHKKQPPRRGQNHTRKQFKSHYLQKKHVQATVVSQTTLPKTEKRYGISHDNKSVIIDTMYVLSLAPSISQQKDHQAYSATKSSLGTAHLLEAAPPPQIKLPRKVPACPQAQKERVKVRPHSTSSFCELDTMSSVFVPLFVVFVCVLIYLLFLENK